MLEPVDGRVQGSAVSAAPVPPPPSLTSAQRARWERDGFLVLPGFAAEEACDALVARARALVDAFDPGEGAASIFSTTDQGRTSDAYFLGSGDQIRFFFEEGAFDARGALRLPRDLALNKIGHALHDLDPVFDAFSRTPALAALAAGLGLTDPVLLQSMYIFKQPHIGGEVVCHQDSTFLYTEPHTVTGFWFALEDATLENGCMWALRGGHRGGLKSRFVRAGDGRVRFVVLDATPWPAFGRENGYVPIEAPKGTLVVLDGLCPHLSGANTSGRSRHAYTLHAVERGARYPEDNWLQRGASMGPARGFGG
jgi:phytanoyl-CoA hydroxylase